MKLLLGGSPCTHWSIAQTKNRETRPEGLGWELFRNYLIAKERYKPDFYLYENNKSIAPAIRTQISAELGVEPILINSALVSAQNRQRLYWTNIPGVELPEDRGIILLDILDSGLLLREKGCSPYDKDSIRNMVSNTITRKTCAAKVVNINRLGGFYGQCTRWGIYDVAGKAPTLTASAGMGGGHIPMYPIRMNIMESVSESKEQGVSGVYEVKDNHTEPSVDNS